MIPKDILKQIRRIQITTSRKATDVFAGRYQSVFKGSGMEFEEVREYTPGDDIRSIDWNVTARTGTPFVKKFVEERQLTIMILLDISMSCRYGTADRLKSELAAELCSVIAFSAVKNSDKVGMITFTDGVEKFIPPRKGLKHVLRVIREALYNQPKGTGTDINNVLEHLNRVVKRRSITFLVSDFIAADFKRTLTVTNKRHDLIAVNILDPSERALPEAGIVKLHDAETGTPFMLDTSDRSVRDEYARRSAARKASLEKIFSSAGVDNLCINTAESYVEPLIKFFKKRERRKRQR